MPFTFEKFRHFEIVTNALFLILAYFFMYLSGNYGRVYDFLGTVVVTVWVLYVLFHFVLLLIYNLRYRISGFKFFRRIYFFLFFIGFISLIVALAIENDYIQVDFHGGNYLDFVLRLFFFLGFFFFFLQFIFPAIYIIVLLFEFENLNENTISKI